ncbi:MAG: transcription elongation factor GreA [Lachnospiraceae bacterium]|nr:transcription elongation factor GreA [Lachnospiraceae bacterium]
MPEKLTRSDVEKIQREIEDRTLNERPKILAELKEARAQGDLSENFEYYAAKRANGQNNSRIRYLENMIKNAIIVEDEATDGAVSMNNTVTVYFPEDDMEDKLKLVTSIRSNSLKGKVSIESPLGQALLGARVGETRTVRVNDEVSYPIEIRAIDTATDDSDDEIKKF